MSQKASDVVYLVEDNEGYRESLAEVLRSKNLTVHAFENGEDFLKQWKWQHRGVLVLDRYLLGGMMGDEVGLQLSQRRCAMPILYLSAKRFSTREANELIKRSRDSEIVDKDSDLSASELEVLKASSDDEIVKAVGEALKREKDLRVRANEHRLWSNWNLAVLSPAEREVFSCIMAGNTTQETAEYLGLKEGGARAHRQNINAKLDELSLTEDDAKVQLVPRLARHRLHDLNALAAVDLALSLRWLKPELRSELEDVLGPQRNFEVSNELALALELTPPNERIRRGPIRRKIRELLVWARANRQRYESNPYFQNVWPAAENFAIQERPQESVLKAVSLVDEHQ